MNTLTLKLRRWGGFLGAHAILVLALIVALFRVRRSTYVEDLTTMKL